MAKLAHAPQTLDPLTLSKLASSLGQDPVKAFIFKANEEYYHWDELRRRPLPAGFSAEEAWAAVKLSRSNCRPLPLVDTRDRPFSYWITDQAFQTIHTIDLQGGGNVGSTITDLDLFQQERDRILIDSLMEEAIATSQIEGAVTTRRIAKDMLRSGRAPRDKSERMIVNGYRTINLIRSRVLQPLSVELLHEIQTEITRDTLDHPKDAGRFRTRDDDIHIVDTRDGETVFTPPPADVLAERLARLIDFANADASSSPFIHPLVRASILHFWLAYEHPYVDGNGRTARALFYWSMLKSGYWLFEFLTISRIILDAPMRYHRAFVHTEDDGNDLTYFLTFQLDVTRRAVIYLHDRLAELRKQQQRMRALGLAENLNSRQVALLHHALRNPTHRYTVESHQRSHNVSNESARLDLQDVVDRSLLVEVGKKRPREFMASKSLMNRLKITREPSDP